MHDSVSRAPAVPVVMSCRSHESTRTGEKAPMGQGPHSRHSNAPAVRICLENLLCGTAALGCFLLVNPAIDPILSNGWHSGRTSAIRFRALSRTFARFFDYYIEILLRGGMGKSVPPSMCPPRLIPGSCLDRPIPTPYPHPFIGRWTFAALAGWPASAPRRHSTEPSTGSPPCSTARAEPAGRRSQSEMDIKAPVPFSSAPKGLVPATESACPWAGHVPCPGV